MTQNICLTENFFTNTYFQYNVYIRVHCVSFWANKWNTSDWVKYVNIRVFSDTYFLFMFFDSVHIREHLAQIKPLYLQILCSIQEYIRVTY